MFGRWSLLLDSASSPNAWWQQAVESSLLACKSCGSRVKCNAWNCKVIFLGSYDDERMSSIPVHFWFSVTGSWTWRIDSVSRPVLLRGLSRQKPTRGQASFASMELVERVVEKWELLHYVWCLKMSKDFLAFSFSQPCVNVNLLNLVCGLFDSFAQSTAEIRELQCFYLGGILVAALWTTGDTRLHVLFGFGSKRWFLKALEESRHANMIQDVWTMYRGMKILKTLCFYVFDCLYKMPSSILISASGSVQAYGAQLVTVAIAQFRCLTCFEKVWKRKITFFFGSQNLWFECHVSAWWFRFAANAQNLEPTRGPRSDVSGTVTTEKPKTRPRGR